MQLGPIVGDLAEGAASTLVITGEILFED